MKYITYNLIWDGKGKGDQPYQAVATSGAELEGGVIVNNNKEYFGYLYGTDKQCLESIQNCKDFNMKELTQTQALDFFKNTIPVNTEVYDIFSEKKFVDYPKVNDNSKIIQELKSEKIVLK